MEHFFPDHIKKKQETPCLASAVAGPHVLQRPLDVADVKVREDDVGRLVRTVTADAVEDGLQEGAGHRQEEGGGSDGREGALAVTAGQRDVLFGGGGSV